MAQSKLVNAVRKVPKNGKLDPNSNDKSGHATIAKATATFSVQALTLIAGFLMYLRLHRIEVTAVFSGRSLGLGGFGFVDNDVTGGGILEVLFWSGVATTLRWISISSPASKRKDFNPWRHLIEWAIDLTITPLTAAVIAYGLRSPRLTLGKNIDLSLDNANVGVFSVLGFLLGFFGYAPRAILVRIWNKTLGPYSGTLPPESQANKTNDKHDLA